MKLVLIGAPAGIGASVTGCCLGPGVLRVTDIGKALRTFGVDVRNTDNVTGPPSPQSPPVDGYRHLPGVVEWNRTMCDAVTAELTDDRIPVLMGGDHNLTIGGISAIAAHYRKAGKKLHAIWVDAHADINANELTPSRNIHGIPVACLLDGGPGEPTGMSDWKPAIGVSNIRQVGLRGVDPGEKRVLVDKGLEAFDMHFLDETGIRHAMERALHNIDGDAHIYLNLGLDFVDPQVAPGVGTPAVGRPTYREAQLVMEIITDTGRLGSIDLVGINPALDIRNTAAELAVDLVESLFDKSTLPRSTEV